MLSLLARRRSIRSYTSERVKRELVQKLTHAALYSASSRGIRPWEIIVVEDDQLLEALSGTKTHGSAFLAGAPLAFVILGIPAESDVWIEDTSIVSSNILIEAEALDLGACWIQIRNRFATDKRPSEVVVREILGIPEDRTVESIIAVGHPAIRPEGIKAEDLHEEKVFFKRYQR